MTEQDVMEAWLYETLSGDTVLNDELGIGGRIYCGLAPVGATYPLVVFSSAAPQDIVVTGAIRIATRDTYRVEVIGRGNGFGAISAIATRVDELLHRGRGEAGTGGVFSCVREAPLSRIEVQDGVRYYHRGGEYRIIAK